jgi:F-type H+-transporting ATPase subunit b
VLTLVTPGYAQEDAHEAPPSDAHAPVEAHEGTEAHGGEHGGEHGAFPPFDPATFASQLIWLALSFGALYLLMSRVALPQIGGILEHRSNRIANDLAEAGRLKEETDAAIAAYEQALAEARQNAHAIGQKARDAMKAEIDADRARTEAGLQAKLDAAEARIADVKAQALKDVDTIAKDATETLLEVLLGPRATQSEIAGAVQAAMNGKG